MRTSGEVERALRLNEKAAAYFKAEFKKMGTPDHVAVKQGPMMAALTALTVLRWAAGQTTADAKSFSEQLDNMDRLLNDSGGKLFEFSVPTE